MILHDKYSLLSASVYKKEKLFCWKLFLKLVFRDLAHEFHQNDFFEGHENYLLQVLYFGNKYITTQNQNFTKK